MFIVLRPSLTNTSSRVYCVHHLPPQLDLHLDELNLYPLKKREKPHGTHLFFYGRLSEETIGIRSHFNYKDTLTPSSVSYNPSSLETFE